MYLNDCIKNGKMDVKNYNCVGFVVVKNSPDVINHWKTLGYNAECDYILFSSWDEMKNYISGLYAFDYLDNEIILNVDEKILYGFVSGKIINNVSRETNKNKWGF